MTGCCVPVNPIVQGNREVHHLPGRLQGVVDDSRESNVTCQLCTQVDAFVDAQTVLRVRKQIVVKRGRDEGVGGGKSEFTSAEREVYSGSREKWAADFSCSRIDDHV